ncbi:MAG: nicotinamide riboside transporter PnuC [Chitinophagaceae bacterium]|nr:nicotinamide mononucleotide transporter [Chitinophagaceae bacterium]MBP6416924.1 nicotinamide mononucleotide transporter [Chitinophagaceae bacterium]HQW42559.1 nicotinamide riboside transporter PnuC [Chitinophagaceae bacterium]
MSLHEIYQQFIDGMRHTTWLEYIAVFAGIASVLFSRKENILVYPTGIINTVLYTWFCFSWWELYAEGSLNFYYTIMSLYGWYAWTRKKEGKPMSITFNNRKDWIISISFFIISWAVLYYILKEHTNSNVPWADSFASAAAYTGMWQMTRKKVENWIWWIITNIVSIPLYFYKHAVFTSVQYVVFLILAVLGLISWIKKTKAAND